MYAGHVHYWWVITNSDNQHSNHTKDYIEFPAPRTAVKDILGGAGSWSALGARLFSPPPQSKSVGWVVDAGSDFPVDLRENIESWETSCVLRETPDRKTTRGHNVYGENEERGESAVSLGRPQAKNIREPDLGPIFRP